MVVSLRNALVKQFGNPSGFLGAVAGLIMKVRTSNRERNLRTLRVLDIQPEDQVLEVGFGPGLAVERAAELACRGRVFGIDHSALMLRQASRRNAKAISAGRVDLCLGSSTRLPDFKTTFDKVFAINVYMFWDQPVDALRSLRSVMKPNGTLCLALQPRHKGTTNNDALAEAERMATSLRAAGFEDVRVEILETPPVNTACVLGRASTEALLHS